MNRVTNPKLKSLEENRREAMERLEREEARMRPHPNGLACPKCGDELWDSSPWVVLSSNPPMKNVHCPACGYQGYAFL